MIEPVMKTPAHRLHAGIGARFERRHGWEIPAAYGPPEDERAGVRENVAIADVTARGKIDLRGSVDEMIHRLPTDPEVQVARLSAHWALILTGPDGLDRWLRVAEQAAGPSGMATDATSIYTGIALLGPKAGELVARLTATNVSTLGNGGATGLQFARIPAILVKRERAVEIYAGAEYGRYLWRTVTAVVLKLGGRAAGWDALQAEGWS